VDIPLLSRIPCDLRLTIKGQWWRHPLIGAGVKALNHVRVEPGDPDSVMRQCVQAFSEGSSIHFFPQGTRSPYGTPERFHKGAFELAIQVNADIQPLVLCDTWMCLPRGGIWVENFRMRMKALPRITPATFDYSLGARALAKHAEDLMYAVWLEELELNNTPAILRRKVERLYRYLGLRAELGVFARLRRDPGLAALHGWVPRSGLILDLGCGYGPVSHWLAQAGPERNVLGIDRDADRIRVARCSACGSQQVTFEARDFREGPLPECQAILMLDVLGEPAAKEDALLRRSFEALVPGGRLILRAAAALTGDYAGRLRELGFSVEAADGMACEGRAALVACKRPT
jgi:SAM-dependent methyltransferase